MSSMGGLSSMQKSAGNRSDFAGFCLLSLVFSLNFALLSMSGGCSSFGPEALSGTNIHSEHQDRIIAISDSGMNWNAAKAWCQEKGGRLPLINGAASLSMEKANKILISSGEIKVEGFGFIRIDYNFRRSTTPWPSGLPHGLYWMGTVDSVHSDRSWFVDGQQGEIIVDLDIQGYPFRAVCVR